MAGLTALAAAVGLLVLPAPASATGEPSIDEVVESDPDVAAAREQLERAGRQRDAVEQRLDEAAAQYETARGEAERLAHEASRLQESHRDRAAAIEDSRDSVRGRLIDAWMHPARRIGLHEIVLHADRASTALHLAGMVDHMGDRADAEIGRLDRVDGLDRDNVHSQAMVTGAAEHAATEARRVAGRLQTALDDARAVVRAADTRLTSAEADAREAEVERRRAAAEAARQEALRREREAAALRAAAGAALSGSTAPPVVVDGRACPLGGPNGFIDSWGYPRPGGRSHRGVDMFAAYGTPVYAVGDGVVEVGSNTLGGLTIHLLDDRGDRFYYAHLATTVVDDGARVRAGQVIATNGNSGNARTTPPHLHWQFHPGGGAAVNPYPLAAALCR